MAYHSSLSAVHMNVSLYKLFAEGWYTNALLTVGLGSEWACELPRQLMSSVSSRSVYWPHTDGWWILRLSLNMFDDHFKCSWQTFCPDVPNNSVGIRWQVGNTVSTWCRSCLLESFLKLQCESLHFLINWLHALIPSHLEASKDTHVIPYLTHKHTRAHASSLFWCILGSDSRIHFQLMCSAVLWYLTQMSGAG